MAQLNPNIQFQNDPDYTGKSRAVELAPAIRPQGVEKNTLMPKGISHVDQTAEYAGKYLEVGAKAAGAGLASLGNIIEMGAKTGAFAANAAETLIRKNIDDRVYEVANKERTASIQQLEAIASGTAAKVNALRFDNEDAGTDEDSADLPADLAELPNTLNRVAGAKNVNNLYYYQRMNSLASDLRAEYPTYKQYIDNQFAKVTGRIPANAYRDSLVTAIAQADSQSNSETKLKWNILFRAQTMGVQGIEAFSKRMGTDTEPSLAELHSYISANAQEAARLTRERAERELANLNQKNKESLWGEHFDNDVASTVGMHFRNLEMIAGKGSPSGQKVADFLMSIAKGDINPKDSEVQGLVPYLKLARAGIARQLIDQASQPDNNGDTYIKVIGQDNVNKKIEAGMKLFDDVIKNLEDGNYPLAMRRAKQSQALVGDTKYKLQMDPSTAAITNTGAALNELHGQAVMNNLYETMFKSGLQDAIQQQVNDQIENVMTPRNLIKDGFPTKLDDNITQLQLRVPDKPEAIRTFLETNVKTVLDPKGKPEGKVVIANKFFQPQNIKMLDKFAMDEFDPQTGKKIDGKFFVYKLFTSPEMSKEMVKLDKQFPGILSMYENWSQRVFGQKLFRQTLQDLREAASNPNIEIGWNSDSPDKPLTVKIKTPKQSTTFHPDNLPGGAFPGGRVRESTIGPGERNYLLNLQNRVENLNTGFESLSNIAKAKGVDPHRYILNTINEMGLFDANFRKDLFYDLTNKRSSIGNDILDTIRGATKGLGFADSTSPKRNVSLDQWLSNPGGFGRRTSNLSDQTIMGADVQQIPPGVSPEEFMRQLKAQK